MASCKCKKAAECEECPEWIFTFADLVMLMMGFFVILWVLKPAPNPKEPHVDQDWLKIAAAIREAFGYIPDPHSKDPVDIEMLIQKLAKLKPNGPHDGGQAPVKPTPHGATVDPSDIRPGKQAAEGGKLLFDKGEAALTAETARNVGEVADIIRGHRNIVIVKGHTSLDDLPEDASPQAKMDLSLRRAQAVADELVQLGVSPDILRVQGCSTFEPIAQRAYTDDAQDENRRVEVAVSNQLVDERQGTAATEPSAPATPDSGDGASVDNPTLSLPTANSSDAAPPPTTGP